MTFKPIRRLPSHAVMQGDDLERQIKNMTHAIGLGHSDIEQLCEWLVDGEPDVDENGDETDSWRNVRPY